MIVSIDKNQLPECLDIIHKSFATVANEFGLTEENCPTHTSFMKLEKLQAYYEWGFHMFGLVHNEHIIGYFSLSSEEDTIYELHNLSILPEYRHNGHGKILLDYAKEKVLEWGGTRITLGIIEESTVLKNWYSSNGFVHKGTQKFDHLPFTAGFMEWNVCALN